MTPNEVERLENFLTESFREGIYFRELRLSYEEMEYIKKKYPKANVKKCVTTENSDEKVWWEINLLLSINNQKEFIDIEKSQATAV
ncbi:hypothetical protein SAMN05446037_1001382 [Anaerovirgula multivorans]|uniref:Uncharacterized protein n=1 Tax=Anaerovirgula multivorans TaxID=312168 RepID=A0A239A7Q8_9FIRM|nr:hypothetical protein [Anaerovirgula multivorans]SNR91341.1 hypothetical protein SAMN05446037_1001382 [Anaerovirgula multivorans]